MNRANIFLAAAIFLVLSIKPSAPTYIYYSPIKIMTPQIVIFILMFLAGINLFIITQNTIRKLIDKAVELEYSEINRKYKETYDKIIKFKCNKKDNDDEKELRKLKVILNILEIEERKIKEINNKKLDMGEIITSGTTSLLPIITLINEIMK